MRWPGAGTLARRRPAGEVSGAVRAVKRFLLVAAAVLAVAQPALAGSGPCSGYRADGDVYVSVSTGLGGEAYGAVLRQLAQGDATFAGQEAVHGTACTATGTEVPHSYAWVEVDGYRLVALDPPTVLYNGGKVQ